MARSGAKLDAELQMEVVADFAATGNASKTGRKYGISHVTVQAYAERHPKLYQEAKERVRLETISYLQDFVRMALSDRGLTDPDKLKHAGVKELAVSVGIAIDKLQLLQGEPTARIEATMNPAAQAVAERLAQALEGMSTEQLQHLSEEYRRKVAQAVPAEYEVMDDDE